MIILKDILARKYGVRDTREKFKEEDLWKNSYKVLEEYPVILSTTFSSRSSLNDEVIYDLPLLRFKTNGSGEMETLIELKVCGFGNKKVEKYGDEIIRCLQAGR